MMTLRSTQLARLTGLSFRQIDYWCRTGVITPVDGHYAGSGTQRRFTVRQAEELRVLARLRDAGLSLERLRSVAAVLAGESLEEGWLLIPLSEERAVAVVGGEGLLADVAMLGGAIVVELGEAALPAPEPELVTL